MINKPKQYSTPFTLIAAVDRKGVIGNAGGLAWHVPSDLAFFKAETMDKTLLMGRKTFQSIGRALPGRSILVLTRQKPLDLPEGVEVVFSIDEACEKTAGAELWIAGGGDLYRQTIDQAGRLIITHLDLDVSGDVFFPSIGDEWRLEREKKSIDTSANVSMRFCWYKRHQVQTGRYKGD